MEKGKRIDIKPIDYSTGLEIDLNELIKTWKKAGYGKEDSEILAEATIKFKNTIGTISVEEATNYLMKCTGRI